MTTQAVRVLACGGEVWVADETTVREVPTPPRGVEPPGRAGHGDDQGPHRAARDPRRPHHGELAALVQPRSRTAEVVAAVEALGQRRPDVPKLLVWDDAPAHFPKRVAAAAHLAGIELAFRPFRAPELMPLGRAADRGGAPPPLRSALLPVPVATYFGRSAYGPSGRGAIRGRRAGVHPGGGIAPPPGSPLSCAA